MGSASSASRADWKTASPSVGAEHVSDARSGWGIIPRTLPALVADPGDVRRATPLGLAAASPPRRVAVAEDDRFSASSRRGSRRRRSSYPSMWAIGKQQDLPPPVARGERRRSFSTRMCTCRQMNCARVGGAWRRAAARPPAGSGSRCRCPAPGRRRAAKATTASITGEKRAIAPHAQVVAVGEPARQDDAVAPCEVRSLCQRYAAGRPRTVSITRWASWSQLEPGKTTTPGLHPSTTSQVKSSITGLASSRLAHRVDLLGEPAPVAPSITRSKTFPVRTSATLPNPRPSSAWCTAFPCGSRTFGFECRDHPNLHSVAFHLPKARSRAPRRRPPRLSPDPGGSGPCRACGRSLLPQAAAIRG